MPLSGPTSSVDWEAFGTVVTPAPTDEYLVRQGGAGVTLIGTRLQLHTLEAGEQLNLPTGGSAAAPVISFGASADTGIFESSANTIAFAIGGTTRYLMNSSIFRSQTSFSFNLNRPAATATTPCYAYRDDLTTGLGRFGAGSPSLIGNGAEAIRAEDPATLAATETSLWLFDLDNGTMEQVTVGAVDSGGVGFKVLRIPN